MLISSMYSENKEINIKRDEKNRHSPCNLSKEYYYYYKIDQIKEVIVKDLHFYNLFF